MTLPETLGVITRIAHAVCLPYLFMPAVKTQTLLAISQLVCAALVVLPFCQSVSTDRLTECECVYFPLGCNGVCCRISLRISACARFPNQISLHIIIRRRICNRRSERVCCSAGCCLRATGGSPLLLCMLRVNCELLLWRTLLNK